MWFQSVTASNLRIYSDFAIQPSSHINLIVGENASGKSSILEAIHLLSVGRSFRTSDVRDLCRHGSTHTEIGAVVSRSDGPGDRIGVRIEGGRKHFILNNQKDARLRDIATHCPSILVSPESHYHFRSKSMERRAVLDWVLFHVKPEFRDLWTRYQRAITQRNAGLRARSSKAQIEPWTLAMAETGTAIDNLRIWAVTELARHFSGVLQRLIPKISGLRIGYEKGWPDSSTLEAAVEADWSKDVVHGLTHSGPHRADIEFQFDNGSRPMLSQGQTRLAYIALRIAQSQLLIEQHGNSSALLLDDITSEIDRDGVGRVFEEAGSMGGQIFLTTTNSELAALGQPKIVKVFHVEQGRIFE